MQIVSQHRPAYQFQSKRSAIHIQISTPWTLESYFKPILCLDWIWYIICWITQWFGQWIHFCSIHTTLWIICFRNTLFKLKSWTIPNNNVVIFWFEGQSVMRAKNSLACVKLWIEGRSLIDFRSKHILCIQFTFETKLSDIKWYNL